MNPERERLLRAQDPTMLPEGGRRLGERVLLLQHLVSEWIKLPAYISTCWYRYPAGVLREIPVSSIASGSE